jgi:hypothetical protein
LITAVVCTPVSFFKVRELRPPGTVQKKSATRFMISRRRTVTVREASTRRLGKEAGRESFGEGGIQRGWRIWRSGSLGWRGGGCRERNQRRREALEFRRRRHSKVLVDLEVGVSWMEGWRM